MARSWRQQTRSCRRCPLVYRGLAYLRMFGASILAMFAGAEVVHQYYRPDLTIPEIPPKPGELRTELLGLKQKQEAAAQKN